MANKAIHRITYRDYAREIEVDLEELLELYPDGLYVSHLREYYGESSSRTMHAISVLEEEGVVQLHESSFRTYYITRKDASQVRPLMELTTLQRRMIHLVMDNCKRSNTLAVSTDYSQLSRLINASAGGLKACLNRLEVLQYLKVTSPSVIGVRGKMVISITPKLRPIFEDYKKAS